MAISWNQKWNRFTLVAILSISIFFFYLFIRNTETGLRYAGLLIAFTFALVAFFLFETEDNKDIAKRWFALPFTTILAYAVGIYYIGMIIGAGLILGGQTIGFQVTDYNIPYAVDKLNTISQQFSIAEIETDPTTRTIAITDGASIAEEPVFSIGLLITAFAIMLLLSDLLEGIFKIKPNRTAIIIGALIISSALFAGVHTLNSTYDTPREYFISAVFRLLQNISLYIFNLPIPFTMGWHRANNLFWMMTPQSGYGLQYVIGAFLTPWGITRIAIDGLLITYAISKRKEFMKGLKGSLSRIGEIFQ